MPKRLRGALDKLLLERRIAPIFLWCLEPPLGPLSNRVCVRNAARKRRLLAKTRCFDPMTELGSISYSGTMNSRVRSFMHDDTRKLNWRPLVVEYKTRLQFTSGK